MASLPATNPAGMDNVRNITGSPIAGIDPHELVDPRPLCHGKRIFLFLICGRELGCLIGLILWFA